MYKGVLLGNFLNVRRKLSTLNGDLSLVLCPLTLVCIFIYLILGLFLMEFIDEAESSYVAQSNPQYAYETYQNFSQYAYGSYHSHVEQQHMNEYEEGANDFEEVDKDF
ncbi:hypothetical protein L1987_30708 [Smallanthus sonchifolius]|uniref:Uncharacterized protein n=1 Tax=Smallanthus sonchifolius TaxID=185202 RepID=A0ACB9I4Z3_9ASTR|nr:hypothetical protein L1987_30708 [Smallanthus sonchifolius]